MRGSTRKYYEWSRSYILGYNNRLAVSRFVRRFNPITRYIWIARLYHNDKQNVTAMANVMSFRVYSINGLTPPFRNVILSSPDSNYNAGINSGILARVLIAELFLNVIGWLKSGVYITDFSNYLNKFSYRGIFQNQLIN